MKLKLAPRVSDTCTRTRIITIFHLGLETSTGGALEHWCPSCSGSGSALCILYLVNAQHDSDSVRDLAQANLLSRFTGTAATLYGFFNTSLPAFPSSISYSVSLDGVPTTNYASSLATTDPDSENSVLAAFTGLPNEEHFVELALHNSGESDGSILLRFDRVILQSEASGSSKQ